MGASYNQQDNLQDAYYTDDVVNLGAEGCEEGEEGYHQEEEEAYAAEFNQDNTEMSEDQIGYTREPAEGDDGYQYEVLDIEISEPIDGEFQVSSRGEKKIYSGEGDICLAFLGRRPLKSLSPPARKFLHLADKVLLTACLARGNAPQSPWNPAAIVTLGPVSLEQRGASLCRGDVLPIA
ncbi:hypothetical protein GOODEAATRI_004041 [Goodea atripinnis]|uniref:Uncharacterized protein n=1 Tax=Goodea atripinnis TaxID=208336 RepID=A0ABV0PV17_9TELE